MQLRDLMELRGIRVSRLADAAGVSRQNIHVAFSRDSFSKELAGRIASALDAECCILPNGQLDFRPNGETTHGTGRSRTADRKTRARNPRTRGKPVEA